MNGVEKMRALTELVADVGGGFQDDLYNLSDARKGLGPGYGLFYVAEGSAPSGRVVVRFSGRAGPSTMVPGDYVTGYFAAAELERHADSVATGVARFLRLTSPQAGHGRVPKDDASGGDVLSAGLAINGQNAQNAGATNNGPTAATDGVSLLGVRGFRLFVSADAGQTLSGAGLVRLHVYHPDLARWAPGRIEYQVDVASVRDLVFPDELVRVPFGRVFPEARDVTVSSGALTLRLETWG